MLALPLGLAKPDETFDTQDEPDHDALRLWLRLFTCSTMIAQHVGSALKREFGSSLPRFDLLSQLDRAPGGLRMGELSERTLSTGGNITWLVRALEIATGEPPSSCSHRRDAATSLRWLAHTSAGFQRCSLSCPQPSARNCTRCSVL